MKRINVDSFTLNTMLAKLLTIQRKYDRNKDELLINREQFDKFVTTEVENNFEYPVKSKERIVAHLSLFLLGNPNNQFSKLSAL